MIVNPGKKFRNNLLIEKPLQIVGTINAYTALLAQYCGYRSIYLSGAGVANASFGLPDLGITTLNDVLEDARRITSTVDLPLLVDIDTGWGNALNIARTVKEMIKADVAAVHIEDQVQAKRCGHRPGKAVVETDEMVKRIKAAVDAKTYSDFVVIARTDALAKEGIHVTCERVIRYVEAGADMIFFEGVRELSDYKTLAQYCNVPILANITEFGLTPLFTKEELATAGVSLILYPLSAFRAMSAAALAVYQTIRQEGTQKNLLGAMQTREDLYRVLGYYSYEKKYDELFQQGNSNG